ncbi:MAG: redoxin domain-containing protein [Planctomycetota bacterium]|jgi:hypothetical protein|nr:redoxin domain-containing protein [Planctomycetota bacterium]
MRVELLSLALLFIPLAMQDPAPAPPKTTVGQPKVGQAAPKFRLNDHGGAAVKVGGKSKTWTVLAFYPKAATPG